VNTRILCLAGWLAAAGVSAAQSASPATSQSKSASWQQLTHQWSKAAATLDAEGNQLADAGNYKEATARYEAWRDLPDAPAEQKALATIKLAQLSEVQFATIPARTDYREALALLAPKSEIAHEVRLRIEDSYRRLENLSGLADFWKSYLSSHGDDPEVGLLLANVLEELHRPADAVPWPHSSTSSPSQPAENHRLQAALEAQRAGRSDEARKALIAAFDAETDPLARLDIAGSLSWSATFVGEFPELVATFQAKSHTENDGWRYAVYLAEMQRQKHDLSAANAALMQAFGPRSRDPLFVLETWRLRVDQKDNADRARLARLLVQIFPTTAHEIELVSALLANNEPAEALKGLHTNEEAISADPMPWHGVLLQAGAATRGRATTRLLETCLAKKPDEWRLRFLLAEARILAGDITAAEKYLRELEAAAPTRTTPALQGPEKDVPDSFYADGVMYASGVAHHLAADFARRNIRGLAFRQELAEVGNALYGLSLSSMSKPSLFLPPPTNLPQTPAEAADAALVIRSVLAQQEGHGAEFITELQATLSKLPRAERIARLSLVQALAPLLQELTAESSAPSGDEQTHAAALEVLLCLASENYPGMDQVDVEPAALSSLLKAFLSREKTPDTFVFGRIALSGVLRRAGQEKEAADIARQALDQWEALPATRRFLALQFALRIGDTEHAGTILEAMVEGAKRENPALSASGFSGLMMNLAEAIAEQKPDDPRIVKWLAAALHDTFAIDPVKFDDPVLRRTRGILQAAQKFPYGGRLVARPSWTWFPIFDIAEAWGKGATLRTAAAQQARELPPTQKLQARLAGICLSWWAKDRDGAIRDAIDLATSSGNEEVHLFAGSMLADVGRYDEARREFEKVSSTDNDIASDKIARLLLLARAQKDTERIQSLAVQLAGLRLSYSDRTALEKIMKEVGLKTEAAVLHATAETASAAAFNTGIAGAVQQFQKELLARNLTTAIDMARRILTRIPPSGNTSTDRYYRRTALDTLRRGNLLDDYTQKLNAQLAADPKSLETLLRLAEASDRHTAVTFYRRATELSPDDLSLQLRLGQALANDQHPAEAVQIWEAVAAQDSQAILGDDFHSYFDGFKAAGQLDRLGAVLSKTTPVNPVSTLSFGPRDVTAYYQMVAQALSAEGKLNEAIQVWEAALTQAQAGRNSAYQQSTILRALIPILLQANRKDDAVRELENYFVPPRPHPALGYPRDRFLKNWSEINGEDFQGTEVMRLAVTTGALDALRAKAHSAAATAAHSYSPERILVLLIDIFQRDPEQLASMRKDFDEILDRLKPAGAAEIPHRVTADGALGTLRIREPWSPQTIRNLRALAKPLAEWPEGRELALHVLEKTPEFSGAYTGALCLSRAKLALSLSKKEAATQALQDWLFSNENPTSAIGGLDAEQQLTAAELLTSVGMTSDAATVLRRLEVADEFRDLHQRLKAVELLHAAGLPAEATASLRGIEASDEFHGTTAQLSTAETLSRIDMTSEAVAILLKIKTSDLYSLTLQLSAAELMTQLGMTAQATTLLKKVQASRQLQKQPELQKRADELAKRLAPAAGQKPGETIKL